MSPAVRHEFIDGEIFAMAGGTVEHSALATTMSGLLLAADGCQQAGRRND